MKIFILLFFTFFQTYAFAQQRVEREDSCITSLRSVKFNEVENGKFKITKDSVPNMIKHLKYCSTNFNYPDFYQDRSFELLVPKYLKKLSYGYGDNDFYYSFNDSNDDDSLTTSIVVYYDFDDSYKNFFLNQIEIKKQEAQIKHFGGSQMYLFKNWRQFSCGKLFLDRNTLIFYCTTDQKRELELQEAILTFKWK